ncbi:hypothetical protein HD554DRAFT_2037722 [Boletus coccyginus]|nr:hypothetical protein HD554DRAFT_2037722 [Boletus coccyginus]
MDGQRRRDDTCKRDRHHLRRGNHTDSQIETGSKLTVRLKVRERDGERQRDRDLGEHVTTPPTRGHWDDRDRRAVFPLSPPPSRMDTTVGPRPSVGGDDEGYAPLPREYNNDAYGAGYSPQRQGVGVRGGEYAPKPPPSGPCEVDGDAYSLCRSLRRVVGAVHFVSGVNRSSTKETEGEGTAGEGERTRVYAGRYGMGYVMGTNVDSAIVEFADGF